MASRNVLHNIPAPNLDVVLHSPGGLAESCPPLGTYFKTVSSAAVLAEIAKGFANRVRDRMWQRL
jgi:hypothetical protein